MILLIKSDFIYPWVTQEISWHRGLKYMNSMHGSNISTLFEPKRTYLHARLGFYSFSKTLGPCPLLPLSHLEVAKPTSLRIGRLYGDENLDAPVG
jgi:hypothetical protein